MSESNSTEGSKPKPWRKTRATLLALGAFATVIAISYAVENVRGRRAWENCKRDLEAKGDVLDWAAYIPASVPEDQNVFAAPNMTQWFVKTGASSKSWTAGGRLQDVQNQGFSGPVAEVSVVGADAAASTGSTNTILRYGDRAASEEAYAFLWKAVGPAFVGLRGDVLVAHAPGSMKPVHIIVQAATSPNVKEMAVFLAGGRTPDYAFQVSPAGSNAFRVTLKGPIYDAAEFLAWSDPLRGEFNQMREALQRPLLRMDGDYDPPINIPIVNFVSMRTVAQTLGMRAQSHLLLGQSEDALRELTLIHDLCRLLDAKPVTLVAGMINVAIGALYTGVVDEGLSLDAWNDSQLATIQKQLAEINLFEGVRGGIMTERASLCRTLEITRPGELAKIFDQNHRDRDFWEKIKDGNIWLLNAAPHGWMFQNEAAGARTTHRLLDGFDATNQVIRPGKINGATLDIDTLTRHFSPYTIWAARMIPNYTRAFTVLARHQTMVNETLIVCALERYHRANHEYPENLKALMPQYLATLPHDVINGVPLKYHRTNDGKFLLYSVGWNEKDDGGLVSQKMDEGDWVWQAPPA